MGDFGDILYVIVLIAFAIIGALGKKKKKTQQEETVPDISKSWEEFEEQMQRKNVFPNNSPPVEYTPVSKKPAEVHPKNLHQQYMSGAPMSYDTVDDVQKLRLRKDKLKTMTSASLSTTVASTQDDKSVDAIDLNIHLSNADDARQAFIYSEIFNRKYE